MFFRGDLLPSMIPIIEKNVINLRNNMKIKLNYLTIGNRVLGHMHVTRQSE